MSSIAETLNKIKLFGLTLIEEYGPELNDMFNNLVLPIMGMAKSFAEILIAINETIESVNERVQNIENDMITSDGFSDAFNDEIYNNDMATKDDLNDVISDKFDELLDELKITRN